MSNNDGHETTFNEDHPFAAELASLRKAVAQFQDEAHYSSLKLQRQSLDISNAHDRVAYVERQNDILEAELHALRANPHPESLPQNQPATHQVQQLTLSLRRLSDKLSLTEQTLLERTAELAAATGEAAKAKLAEENAYGLASRIRGREEEGKSRERALGMKVKAAEEAAKMSDLVVKEYADLVRALHGGIKAPQNGHVAKSASISSDTGVTSLREGKAGLRRLVADFSTATEKLETELARVQGDLSVAEGKLEAERKALEQSRQELANAQYELQQLKLEDNTAAKMVSRYMKFSQKSTDLLQETISSLKTRHTATTDSLSSQLSNLASQLHFSEHQTEKLRNVLDELGGELMKETYGRRREVALRIRLIGREEKLREELERWVLRAEEGYARNASMDPGGLHSLQENMVHNAHRILESSLGGVTESSSGSVARIMVAESAVRALSEELEKERARRVYLVGILARDEPMAQEQEIAAQEVGGLPPQSESQASLPSPLLMQKPLPPEPEPSSSPRVTTPAPVVHGTPSSPDVALVDGELSRSPEAFPHGSPLSAVPPASAPSLLPMLPTTKTPAEASEELSPLSPLPQEVELPATIQDLADEEETGSKEEEEEVEAEVAVSSAEASQVLEPVAEAIPPAASPASSAQAGVVEQHVQRPAEEVAAGEAGKHQLVEVLVPEPSMDSREAAINAPGEEPSSLPLDLLEVPVVDSIHQIRESEIGPTLPIPSLLFTDADIDTKPPVASISIPESPSSQPPPLKLPPLPDALLAELTRTSHRYDELQRGFRDCHRSLEALKQSLRSPPPGSQVDPEVLQAAAKRLEEWNEDARVELEIRLADEELVARGYEALLSIPGALASPGLTPLPSARTSALLGNADEGDRTPSMTEVESQVRAFISGEEPSVKKAYEELRKKLGDVEHDIAVLKRAMHEEVVLPSPPPTSSEALSSGGWVSWIRSTPSTPAGLNTPPALGTGSGPVPTFGNVMSSPRLRHSPSLRKVSGPLPPGSDPFASLGLKVPMPSHIHSKAAVPNGLASGTGGLQQQRARTISSMYMLGLGARSSTGVFGSPSPRGAFAPARKSPFSAVGLGSDPAPNPGLKAREAESEDGNEESDVE